MNNLGAVHGNKITPKGEAMEKKHMADKAEKAPETMKGMHISIHKGEDGKVSGHMVSHEFEPKGSRTGAFMEHPPDATHMFGPKGEAVGGGMPMMAHLQKHLGIGAAPAPKTAEAEMKPSEQEEESEEGE